MDIPVFTIIILNYNGLKHLQNCLPSVMQLEDKHYNVMVVDNGSTDDSCDYINKEFPEITLLKNKKNLGFAAGNNRGMELAFDRGIDFVAFLNNDTRVDSGWLKGFRKAFSLHPSVGICGAKILDWEGKTVEYNGTVFHVNNASGGYVDEPVESGILENIHETAYACGGAMAISLECYRAIRGFDETFTFYNEDVDLSLRAWITGFRVLYSPYSITYHRRGASVIRYQSSSFRDYYGLRNALTTVIKDYEWATLRCIYKDIFNIYLRSGRKERIKGFFYNMLILPLTLFKRHAVQRMRVRSDEEIFIRTAKQG